MRKSIKVLSALGAALVLGSGVAMAMPGHGPGRGHGPGFDGPGIGMVIERLHDKLNLNPDQEAKWQQLRKDARDQFQRMRESRKRIQEMVSAELAKPAPDLVAINAAVDAAQDEGHAAMKRARHNAVDFYGTLTPEQQAIVIGAMKERKERMEKHRAERAQQPR